MRDQLFLLYNRSFCTDHTLKEQLWWSLYILTAVKFYVCDVTFLNDSRVNYVRKFTLFYITQCLTDFMIQTQPQMNDNSMRYYIVII